MPPMAAPDMPFLWPLLEDEDEAVGAVPVVVGSATVEFPLIRR